MVSYCPHLGAKVWKLVRWVKGLKNWIDKSHKKRYILFINALKKSVHRLGPHREPGAAENPAGYRRGTVTLEQKR